MAFQSKYKSRWTGPQIDDSIEMLQKATPTPSAGGVAIYNSNGNLETNKPTSNNETVRLQDISNPNLLVNGDFRVNQRGFTTNNSSSTYTVDRWYKQYAGAIQITLNSDNTITATQLTSTGTEMTSALQQTIESSEVYIGKSVTASVNVTNVVGSYWNLIISARSASNLQLSYEQVNISGTGIKNVTLENIPSDTKYLRFTIAVWRLHSSNNDNITFKECKLELGDVATAFTPKNYSEELADCQMPYMETGTSTTYSNPNLLINGDFQVNQRGQTSWSSVSTYTVDCWHINGDSTLTYSNGNMTFVGGGVTQDYFVQYLDPTKLKLWGKTVTMSCEFSDGKILVATGTFPASFSSAGSIVPQTGYYYNIALRGYLYNANKFGFTLDVAKNANGTIKWCKMEIGGVLTPFIPKPYAEELSACQMPLQTENNGLSTTYSNPNLLINGDFKINQRGLTTSTVGKYNFDRWKSWISNATFTFDTTANCLKIVVTGTGQTYQQYLELATSEQLYGKTLTLSAELSSDGVTFYKYSNTRAAISSTGGNSAIDVLGGAQLTQGTSAEGLVYAHLKLADNQTLYVRYMKLEVGSVATPFSPRPYAEELELCKRYYLKLTADASTKFYAMTFAYTTTNVGAFIPCKLRTSPTLAWANLHYRSGSQNTASVSAVSVNGFTTEAVSLQVTTTAVAGESGLLRSSSATGSYIALEAEI